MINLLRMDWYRFKYNKIMYLLLLVFCLFEMFGIFMMKQYGEQMATSSASINQMNISEFIQYSLAQTPSWIMFYILIFTIYFYMSEYNSGFYKNYITMKNARTNTVLSKILMQGIFTLLMFVVLLVSVLIGGGIFFDHMIVGEIAYLFKLMIGQFLLHWAYSSIILCIAMITKSILTSLMIGIFILLNVLGLVVGSIETWVDSVYISQYSLVNTITNVLDFNSMRDLVHVFAVAIISLLLFSVIAIKYKWREDLS